MNHIIHFLYNAAVAKLTFDKIDRRPTARDAQFHKEFLFIFIKISLRSRCIYPSDYPYLNYIIKKFKVIS